MTIRRQKILLAHFALTVTILACGAPAAPEVPEGAPPATDVVAVTAAPAPTATATLIQHQIIPVSLPANRSDHAGDYDSSKTAEENKSNGGDRFTFEQFERPFNANSMDVYFPELDILDTYVYEDDIWVFGTVQVVDRSAANSSPYRFAMQIDTEVDGKGDFLVIAENPTSTEWTTNGVRVYFDNNSDVGDISAMFTDENSQSDGFESIIFDQGNGVDAGMAWVRVSEGDANTVEIAIKKTAIGTPGQYMIDMWAGHGLLDASQFDFSDHFTHDQAGAADPGFPNFYPIKAVFELDNTCRMAVGFEPSGYEPGVCEQPTVKPGAPGPVACTASQIQIAFCVLNGGAWNSSTCTCTPPTPIPPPR